MVGRYGYWDGRSISEFEWSRYLEHTQEDVKSKFLPLSDVAIKELMGYPALFAYEFSRDDDGLPEQSVPTARVGRVLEIRRRSNEIQFSYEFDTSIDPIPMEMVAKLAWDLDINVSANENYRTHWAIKDVDLLAVLKKSGLVTETHPVAPEFAEQLKRLATDVPDPSGVKPKVFIVHGRDDGIKNEVGRWLARIGLDDIVLHEQPNLGRALMSKFQQVADGAAFAVVIMTPDDVGGLAGGEQAYRARQNVIFELGFFLGKLGPERVAALVVGPDIERPSDYEGVAYISYDQRGAWKLELAREFAELHIPFDPLKAF